MNTEVFLESHRLVEELRKLHDEFAQALRANQPDRAIRDAEDARRDRDDARRDRDDALADAHQACADRDHATELLRFLTRLVALDQYYAARALARALAADEKFRSDDRSTAAARDAMVKQLEAAIAEIRALPADE